MNGDVPKFSLVKFKTLIRDTRGPTDPVNEVLHTQEELDAYVESTQDKQKPKHAVAFPEERAVAVALGSRPHGGYHCEIIAVVQETGGFVGMQHHVLYVEQVPHGLATDMVTFPQHVIRLRGLSGVVSFRQVPDWLGHSLHALAGAITGPVPTTLAVGEEAGQGPTTLATGEEAGGEPTTRAVGEEGGVATTRAVGEEHLPTALFGEHPVTRMLGEEGPTGFVGEHPTTFMVGEEGPTAHPTTFMVGEEEPTAHPTTLMVGEEGPTGAHPTTLMVGEEGPTGAHPTTLMVGEEGPTGAHPTTLMVGEEGPTGAHPTTLMVGEEGPTVHPTTHMVGEESPTAHFGEHLTTFMAGEEGHGPGQGGGHGPFG